MLYRVEQPVEPDLVTAVADRLHAVIPLLIPGFDPEQSMDYQIPSSVDVKDDPAMQAWIHYVPEDSPLPNPYILPLIDTTHQALCSFEWSCETSIGVVPFIGVAALGDIVYYRDPHQKWFKPVRPFDDEKRLAVALTMINGVLR